MEEKRLLEEISGILRGIGDPGSVPGYYWKLDQYAERLLLHVLGGKSLKAPG